MNLIALEVFEHVDHPSAGTALIPVPASAIDELLSGQLDHLARFDLIRAFESASR